MQCDLKHGNIWMVRLNLTSKKDSFINESKIIFSQKTTQLFWMFQLSRIKLGFRCTRSFYSILPFPIIPSFFNFLTVFENNFKFWKNFTFMNLNRIDTEPLVAKSSWHKKGPWANLIKRPQIQLFLVVIVKSLT